MEVSFRSIVANWLATLSEAVDDRPAWEIRHNGKKIGQILHADQDTVDQLRKAGYELILDRK